MQDFITATRECVVVFLESPGDFVVQAVALSCWYCQRSACSLIHRGGRNSPCMIFCVFRSRDPKQTSWQYYVLGTVMSLLQPDWILHDWSSRHSEQDYHVWDWIYEARQTHPGQNWQDQCWQRPQFQEGTLRGSSLDCQLLLLTQNDINILNWRPHSCRFKDMHLYGRQLFTEHCCCGKIFLRLAASINLSLIINRPTRWHVQSRSFLVMLW